ncbi:MAG: hypothetical protein K1060chlam1_01429 [Candidatus Anoxychlamydiales bacterium]|nr:hypothetical protein [Candidatus Anoxychlamydiales bacterium]
MALSSTHTQDTAERSYAKALYEDFLRAGIEGTRVPGRMSYVNALYALWRNSGPGSMPEDYHHFQVMQADKLFGETAEKVHQAVIDNIDRQYYNIDYHGGRPIKTEFINFPRLDASGYDAMFEEEGAAQIALFEYSLVPLDERFDRGDNCSFSDVKK